MSIEHQILQSRDPGGPQVNEYTNCFYACRFCNGARGAQPNVASSGARLLDPCQSVWATRFMRVGDRLVPAANDGDAAYTHQVYDLDDPRKKTMRRTREDVLTEAFRVISKSPVIIERLLREAEAQSDRRAEFVALAESLGSLMARARRDLVRFSAVPFDADPTCRCATSEACNLPAFLEVQVAESAG